MCPCFNPCILIFSNSFVLVCILASSHPHILMFISVSLCPCILGSSYPRWCVLTCVLASSHPHIVRPMCVCWYPRTLTASYPQIYVSLGSHLQGSVFSIRMNDCILTTSSPLVLGIFASHSVNNLQMLRTGQAFILDSQHTRVNLIRNSHWELIRKKGASKI